jgi:hypothetical protein
VRRRGGLAVRIAHRNVCTFRARGDGDLLNVKRRMVWYDLCLWLPLGLCGAMKCSIRKTQNWALLWVQRPASLLNFQGRRRIKMFSGSDLSAALASLLAVAGDLPMAAVPTR